MKNKKKKCCLNFTFIENLLTNHLPPLGNNSDDQNILDSIHNSTYFAVTVLEEIKRYVRLPL